VKSEYTLTVYRADGVTPWFEVGTSPEHPAPYLHAPGEYDQAEIDLLGGRAMIGQLGVRVIDPALGADHQDRFLTRLLGIPAGEPGAGHSAVNGRRAVFRRTTPAPAASWPMRSARCREGGAQATLPPCGGGQGRG